MSSLYGNSKTFFQGRPLLEVIADNQSVAALMDDNLVYVNRVVAVLILLYFLLVCVDCSSEFTDYWYSLSVSALISEVEDIIFIVSVIEVGFKLAFFILRGWIVLELIAFSFVHQICTLLLIYSWYNLLSPCIAIHHFFMLNTSYN